MKLESSEAFFAEVREKSVVGFKVFLFYIFCKIAVLNICRYLERFYTYTVKSFLPKDAI